MPTDRAASDGCTRQMVSLGRPEVTCYTGRSPILQLLLSSYSFIVSVVFPNVRQIWWFFLFPSLELSGVTWPRLVTIRSYSVQHIFWLPVKLVLNWYLFFFSVCSLLFIVPCCEKNEKGKCLCFPKTWHRDVHDAVRSTNSFSHRLTTSREVGQNSWHCGDLCHIR